MVLMNSDSDSTRRRQQLLGVLLTGTSVAIIVLLAMVIRLTADEATDEVSGGHAGHEHDTHV